MQLAIYDPDSNTALKLPKRSVTFIGLSCTGSTIQNGLFKAYEGRDTAQFGVDKNAKNKMLENNKIELSQLSGVSRSLCQPGHFTSFKDSEDHKLTNSEKETSKKIYGCKKRLRDIDVLMLSIGGNDIEFSRLVMGVAIHDDYTDTLNDVSDLIEFFDGQGLSLKPRYAGNEEVSANLRDLALNYDAVAKATKSTLAIKDTKRVVLSAFPYVAYGVKDWTTKKNGHMPRWKQRHGHHATLLHQ